MSKRKAYMIIWGGKEICLGKQRSEVTYWTKGKFIITDPKVQLPHLACSRMSFLVLIHHFQFLSGVQLFPFSLERGSHVIYSGLETNYATEDDLEVLFLCLYLSNLWIPGAPPCLIPGALWAGLPQWLTSWSRARFISYHEISLRAATFQSFPDLFCFA